MKTIETKGWQPQAPPTNDKTKRKNCQINSTPFLKIMPSFTSGQVLDPLDKYYNVRGVSQLLRLMKPGMDASVIESLHRHYHDIDLMLPLLPAFSSGKLVDSLARNFNPSQVKELLQNMKNRMEDIEFLIKWHGMCPPRKSGLRNGSKPISGQNACEKVMQHRHYDC